ncbi:hypothetical protein CCACVL1_09850 [Corchorus capsularis]|uniref:Uncharacterized protein n=1 Tax=Corchorus capsularis TaxID=210143 RepID=A0A1R3ITX7_COCAP|nr:hypothetical protein CCACVL1_09850 [Corchorus capsularis]
MDARVPISNRNESWTNEKHVHFLNSMEARFVRTMLENNGRHSNLRLDRQLPDSSDSTLDFNRNQTRKKHSTSVDFIGTSSKSKMKARPDKRSRRPPPPCSQPHDHASSQDQVVPQIETRMGDNKDEKDLPNIVPVQLYPYHHHLQQTD